MLEHMVLIECRARRFEICIQNLFEFGLKMKMEKIELDKHLI